MSMSHPHAPFPQPVLHDDGAITAIVSHLAQLVGGAWIMSVAVPSAASSPLSSGQYVLARCGAQTELERAEHWPTVLRTPLFVTVGADAAPDAALVGDWRVWELVMPQREQGSRRWLCELTVGAQLHLLGPMGHGFTRQPLARNLLLLTDAARLPLLFVLMEQMLDQGGRVTLLLRTETPVDDALRRRLPIPVELRLAATEREWVAQLTETIRWADQVAAALPNAAYAALVDPIRQARFRLEPGFAQVLVEADLACGVGACLACTVPLPDGSRTRACVHGPVFDLATLFGR